MRVWCSWVRVVVSCVALAACGGHSLDVGSNDAGASGATDAGPPGLILGPSPDASGVTTQVWVGHLVNQSFPDGSDALTMTIDFAPDGQVTGSLLLGDGALLQPPTDPNVGYPPGNQGVVSLVEGFPYTILDGKLSDSHVTFDVSEYEVWTQWCALQTPVLQTCSDGNMPGVNTCPDFYTCIAGSAVEFGPTGCDLSNLADGAASPIDCGKLRLCGDLGPSVCQCSAATCHVSTVAVPTPSFDLVLAGTKAEGTMAGYGDYTFQFTRSR